MDERRRFTRYEIKQMIKIAFNNIENIAHVKGLNISKSGLLCETDQHLNQDAQVYLMITIPLNGFERKIEIQAKVIRSEKSNTQERYNVAVDFMFIEKNNRAILNNYIDSLEAG